MWSKCYRAMTQHRDIYGRLHSSVHTMSNIYLTLLTKQVFSYIKYSILLSVLHSITHYITVGMRTSSTVKEIMSSMGVHEQTCVKIQVTFKVQNKQFGGTLHLSISS